MKWFRNNRYNASNYKQNPRNVRDTNPTGDDDAGDDRNEGNIRDPSLPLDSHEISEDSREKGRGGANSLVKRDGQVPKRDIPTNDGSTEDEAESGDLEKLDPRAHGLHGHNAEPGDGYIAEQRAGGHMAHGEEDRVAESIVGEQVLVQKEKADVARVPRRHKNDREGKSVGRFRRRRHGFVVEIWIWDSRVLEGMDWIGDLYMVLGGDWRSRVWFWYEGEEGDDEDDGKRRSHECRVMGVLCC